MRILFIQHASIFEGYGGVEYYLDDFVSMAASLYGNENVCVVAPGQEAKVQRSYAYHLVPRPEKKLANKIHNRLPWRLFQKADEVISSFKPTLIFNSHANLGPMVWLLAQRHSLPYVTCAYGIDCWGYGDLKFHDELALRRSDRIISISHWTKKILVERGYSEDLISVVQPRLPQHFCQLPYTPHLSKKPFTLLTVSRLSGGEAYKGHDHVIRALAILRADNQLGHLRYVIMGDGDDRARLEELAQELNVATSVSFVPAVKDRAELDAIYRTADLFVMPSRFGKWKGRWRGEGFGIVYLEAAAWGVPSIAYDCGGATDIIVDDENGFLVPQDDIPILAETILRLSTNPALCQRLGKRAHDMVMERFTEKPIRSQMAKAFEPYGLVRVAAQGRESTDAVDVTTR